MTRSCLIGAIVTLAAAPLAGQSQGAVAMPAGKYTIQSRDTTVKDFPELPFELKGNGTFVITMSDGTFSGKFKQDNGVVTYADQGCMDDNGNQKEASYELRSERGGFALAVKQDPCEGRGTALSSWLFVPVKR